MNKDLKLPAQVHSNQRSLLMATMLAFIMLAAVSATAESLSMRHQASEAIDKLLSQLDANKFVDREQATDQLVSLGQQAIEPVALYIFAASPEATWRSRRVLKQIATESDDEETSLKAISVLILLGHGVDQELSNLLTTWKRNRSSRAMKFLLAKGATQQLEVDNRFLLRQQQIIQRTFPLILNDETTKAMPEPNERTALDEKHIRREIARIVSSDFEEVQRYVADHLPGGLTEDQQLEQNPFVIGGGRGIVRIVGAGNSGGMLEFDDRWRGDSDDLNRLRELDSLTAIRFSNQTLTDGDLKTIERLDGLAHIGFDQTTFSGRPLTSLELPDSIRSIELGNLSIDRPTINWLTSYPLDNLILNRCEISSTALAGFTRVAELQFLELRGVLINPELFASLADIRGLGNVTLTGCQFEPQAYRDFLSLKNPQTTVLLNPTGFLGVQALPNGQDPGNWSCRIDMVVPGSGADKAGIQTGDVIESVNGDSITVFEELRMHISLHNVGDKMEFQVLRDGKRIKMTAVLGENPNNLSR